MFTIQPGRETVTKTFRLPVNMAAELEQLAADNNLSLNNVVVQCLDVYKRQEVPQQAANPAEGDAKNSGLLGGTAPK